MDGSAAPFIYLIQEAGVKRLPTPRALSEGPAADLADARRQAHRALSVRPLQGHLQHRFDHPLLRHQSRTMRITEESFVEEIAPARTFTFLKEVEMLRQHGLALGGSLENAIVLGDTGVLNNALRFEDEFVRHKILDVIGDMALVGHPMIGHLVAHRGGHALHTAFAAQVLEERDAWTLVEAPVDPAEPAGRRADARARARRHLRELSSACRSAPTSIASFLM